MKYFAVCFLLIALAACKNGAKRKLPYYNTADFMPLFTDKVADSFHQIRPFQLIDQTGSAFTQNNMDGKISVVDFFFTSCPGICPKMTNNMKVLQDTFVDDAVIQLISHSVTPEKDTVAALKEYAEKKGVNDKRWRLLTGPKNEIYNLGRKYYFVEEDLGENRDTSVFLHTENFVLVDKQRHIRGIYNGLSQPSIQSLIADIRELEKE
jgi:protein SCO1/2